LSYECTYSFRLTYIFSSVNYNFTKVNCIIILKSYIFNV